MNKKEQIGEVGKEKEDVEKMRKEPVEDCHVLGCCGQISLLLGACIKGHVPKFY